MMGAMSSATKPSRVTWIIVGVVAVIVAVAAVAALGSSGGDADVPEGVEQTRPVAVSGTPLPGVGEDGADPAIGMTVPTVNGATFDGTALEVAPGRPTLVTFLAHWCPHCRREVPRLVEWQTSGQVPEGLDVVAVATGTSDDQPNYPPSAWLEEEEFPFPVLADSEDQQAAVAYGLQSYPFFVLFDEDGTVLWRYSGEIESDLLTEQIELALGD
jgi:thiol-disulfide isomerase/thioredoxin